MRRKLTTSTAMTAVMAAVALLLVTAAPALAGNHDTRSEGRSENADNSERQDGNGGNSDSAPSRNGDSETTEDNDDDGLDNEGRDADGNGTYPNPSKHPSGKDRYQEAGGSGNQGKSQSDPDGESNGGADKPGGSGGEDIYDQDGNNGCGNDQDFEDDNNGNCGGKGKRNKGTDEDETVEDEALVGVKNATCPDGSTILMNEQCSTIDTVELDNTELDNIELDHNLAVRGAEDEVTKVLGIKIARHAAAAAAQPAAPEVLGVRLSPALSKSVVVAGAVLPFTGGELLVFVALALGLIGAGAVMMLRRRES